ncbi:MAG: DM13 domain-containing protein [Candidatus Uhrbacteria bacterium]|nr:DM13 domain-containing protein [Candidatus Uhrbacteria bacterium]
MRKSLFVLMIGVLFLGVGCLSSGPSDEDLARATPSEIELFMQQALQEHPLKPLSNEEKEQEIQNMRRAVQDGKIERVAEFVPGTHEAQGSARIVKLGNRYVLTISEDFFLKPAPEIHLLLSVVAKPGNFTEAQTQGKLELGKLKTNLGGQIYDVPSGFDPSRYQSVVLYSKPFKSMLTVGIFHAP